MGYYFYPMLTWEVVNFIVAALLIWVILLSFWNLKTLSHYRKLTKGAHKQTLDQVLERIINVQDATGKRLSQISDLIAKVEAKQKTFFAKSALVRFNPFEETGGDQSFVVALLDGANNGIVISSLHSREGTRVYAKSVVGAKASTHPFSKEEKEVVEKAARQV